MRELHSGLNIEALRSPRNGLTYPHLTIVKMSGEQVAENAFEMARERWAVTAGSRRILLERLTFVREDVQNCWIDLAPVRLGRTLVSR